MTAAATVPFAVVTHHNALLDVIRRRIIELNISYETVEDISGLQKGYLAKVLTTTSPPKRIGPFLWFILLESLGLESHLVESPELMEKLRDRFSPRKSRLPSKSKARAHKVRGHSPDFCRIRARRGGYARAARLSAEQLSASGRTAAVALNSRLSSEQRAASARQAALARWRLA